MDRVNRTNWDGIADKGIFALLKERSSRFANLTAFHHWNNREWKSWTYEDLVARVRIAADHLVADGIKDGDRVAILSESRPEWVAAFFAALKCGAIVVPLDIKLTLAELSAILANSQPRVIFASAPFRDTARQLSRAVPSIQQVVELDDEATWRPVNSGDVSSDRQFRDRNADETAEIVYTSGTTGQSKGVMITFSNLLYQCDCLERIMRVNSEDLFLSILPLNHLFELSIGLLGGLFSGAAICYANTLYPHELVQMMREKRVTRMVTVPLFLKMLKASIEKQVNNSGAARRWAFRFAMRVADRVPSQSFRRMIFHTVHKQFGGRLRQFFCGGAPLDLEVGRFFDLLGIAVYQGYGLTETGPVVAVNTPMHNRPGSVGRPLPSTTVRILSRTDTEDGEIVVQGPGVMKGYYKDGFLTREVIDMDGWFHTGDLGRLDDHGYLHITGRIKNIIVLGSGKKVSPEEVEAVIHQTPLFKEVCVVGKVSRNHLTQGTESVSAVVVPSELLVQKYVDDLDGMTAEVRMEIERLAQELAPYKRPSEIFLRFEELPKTSTRKVKRSKVLDWITELEEQNEHQHTRRGVVV